MSPSSLYLVAMATEPTPEYKEFFFFPFLVVLIQRHSAVKVLTRVRKNKTTCLVPHIVGTNPYNLPEGHHLPGWLPGQPILS